MTPERFVEDMRGSGHTLVEITETVENYARYWQAYGPYDMEKQTEITHRIRRAWDRLDKEDGRRSHGRRAADDEDETDCDTGRRIQMDVERGILFENIRTYAPVDEPSGERRLDIGRVVGDPYRLMQASGLLRDEINGLEGLTGGRDTHGREARSVGGLEFDSISIATTIAQLDGSISSFSVRSGEAGGRIEGRARSPAVLVCGLIETPGPVVKAIELLHRRGVRVDFVIALVHSGTKELYWKIKRRGAELHWIFPKNAFSMPDYKSWIRSLP